MSVINLGKQGETNVRRVQLDVSRLVTLFGPGTVQLLHRRPGDVTPYPVALTRTGDVVTWTVTAADTAYSGEGQAELQYFAGDSLAKSETYTTTITASQGDAGATPPEPQAGWVTQVLQAGNDAAEAAERAENAVLHPPIIGENGNWLLWDFELEVYVDSGKPSSGGGPGGGGAVQSVNGKTGAVSLSAADVGARPDTWTPTATEVGALPAGTKIPAKTSDLTNDSGFITKAVADLSNYYLKSETLTKTEINALVSAIPKFSIQVVSALPTSGISTTTVYLVKDGADGNLYTEYIYVGGAWEILGSQRVDLTGYATEVFVREYAQPKGDYATKAEIPSVVQTTGGSSTAVMSQAAVTALVDDAVGWVAAALAEI